MLSYWIEVILYVLTSVVFAILAFGMITLAVRSRKLSNLLVKSNVENVALKEKLAEVTAIGENKKLEHTEGFVKFISDSRNWAFDYIEDAQKAIAELKEYFESVGMKGTEEEQAELIDRLNHVFSFLPEDSES